MNLLILLLIALPACLAQFSIQGPSDGNRVAQGLRIDEGKGIQYTNQNEPQDSGFSIQGASDGNAQIQGASDAHSNFHIQAPHHGGAERYLQGPITGDYNIQGGSDGQNPYIIERSPDGSSKSIEYNDPSGLRVNWKSYDRPQRGRRPHPQQEQSQYAEAPAQSLPRASHRQRAQAPRRPPPPPEPVQQAKTLDSAPSHIKHLLQLQQQLPYVNLIPEPFRYENLLGAPQSNEQQPRYQSDIQEQQISEQRRPAYRGKSRGPSRQRRQAQKAPARSQQQYRKVPQPPAEPQYRYSPNLPPQLQELLKFQAQTPYINSIPEPLRFNPEPAARMQIEMIRNHYQELLRQQPATPVVHTVTPRVLKPTPVRRPPQEPDHSREKRQAPHRQGRPQQLPAEPAPQYSTNIPGHLQSLLQFQAQIPYNIIANQINYRPDKPYVPQPVKPAPAQQAQYQSPPQYQNQPQPQYQGQQPQYQGQPQYQDAYQGQQSAYSQSYAQQQTQPQYPQQGQSQLIPYQQPGVRPVTENQY